MTSVARRQEQDDSGEYSDASQDIEQNNSGNDAGQQESDYDSQRSDSEHSDGGPDKTGYVPGVSIGLPPVTSWS